MVNPHRISKKLERDIVNLDELLVIINVLAISFEQSFTLENGEKIENTLLKGEQ